MDNISAFLLGTIIAIFYILDVIYSKKGNWFFIRSLGYLLSVAFFFNKSVSNQAIYGVAVGLIIGYLCVYFGVYKRAIKKIEEFDGKDEDLEFFNLLMNGYSEFKKKIREKREILEKKQEEYNKTYLKIHDELKDILPKFIVDIYSNMCKKK